MKYRAVIFDIYNTLLTIGPPPANTDAPWEALWHRSFSIPPRITLEAFTVETEKIIAREHASAHALGIKFPEIYWPAVAKEVLPELDRLNEADLDLFLFAHAQLLRSVKLHSEVEKFLHSLVDQGVPFGLVSNCQPYTLHELASALESTGLSLGAFQPDLCFLSWKHGFSKPDPHVFRLLAIRLQARGISAADTLVVGDRLDNDIEPARAQGFQTWHLTEEPPKI